MCLFIMLPDVMGFPQKYYSKITMLFTVIVVGCLQWSQNYFSRKLMLRIKAWFYRRRLATAKKVLACRRPQHSLLVLIQFLWHSTKAWLRDQWESVSLWVGAAVCRQNGNKHWVTIFEDNLIEGWISINWLPKMFCYYL